MHLACCRSSSLSFRMSLRITNYNQFSIINGATSDTDTSTNTGSFSRRKERHRERQNRFANKFQNNNSKTLDNLPLPDFQDLLRKMYKKSHPDLLRSSYPEQAEVNDSSMQILNGILSSIKTCNEYPPATLKTIPFFMKKSMDKGNYKESELDCKYLTIQTGGGYSKRKLTESFEDFFGERFQWSKEYFPSEDNNSAEQ